MTITNMDLYAEINRLERKLEMRKKQVDRLQWEREALESENERLRALSYENEVECGRKIE